MRVTYAEYRRINLMHIQHQQVNIEAWKIIYLVSSAFLIPQESGYQELVRFAQLHSIDLWIGTKIIDLGYEFSPFFIEHG